MSIRMEQFHQFLSILFEQRPKTFGAIESNGTMLAANESLAWIITYGQWANIWNWWIIYNWNEWSCKQFATKFGCPNARHLVRPLINNDIFDTAAMLTFIVLALIYTTDIWVARMSCLHASCHSRKWPHKDSDSRTKCLMPFFSYKFTKFSRPLNTSVMFPCELNSIRIQNSCIVQRIHIFWWFKSFKIVIYWETANTNSKKKRS